MRVVSMDRLAWTAFVLTVLANTLLLTSASFTASQRSFSKWELRPTETLPRVVQAGSTWASGSQNPILPQVRLSGAELPPPPKG
jgi:hypothetical protein